MTEQNKCPAAIHTAVNPTHKTQPRIVTCNNQHFYELGLYWRQRIFKCIKIQAH